MDQRCHTQGLRGHPGGGEGPAPIATDQAHCNLAGHPPARAQEVASAWGMVVPGSSCSSCPSSHPASSHPSSPPLVMPSLSSPCPALTLLASIVLTWPLPWRASPPLAWPSPCWASLFLTWPSPYLASLPFSQSSPCRASLLLTWPSPCWALPPLSPHFPGPPLLSPSPCLAGPLFSSPGPCLAGPPLPSPSHPLAGLSSLHPALTLLGLPSPLLALTFPALTLPDLSSPHPGPPCWASPDLALSCSSTGTSTSSLEEEVSPAGHLFGEVGLGWTAGSW